MDYVIETKGLTKYYKNHRVVNQVNLHVQKNKIYGFVGPNGAGKSTIMKMILNLVQPDAGEVIVFGEKITDKSYETFKRIGSIIENAYFYDRLSARENLQMHCDYMGYLNPKRMDEVLELVGLQNERKKPVKNYSLGMRQRLAIARAILTMPELLILDEPINALDPEGIKEMRSLIKTLNKEYGTTVFISSHILAEVELIADCIGIIQNGNLKKELTIEEIHNHQTEYVNLQVDDINRTTCVLEQLGISKFEIVGKDMLRIYHCPVPGSRITKELIYAGIEVESIFRKQDTLEEYFFELLGGDGQ